MAQAIANGRVFVGSWKDPNGYTVYVNWLEDGTAVITALTNSAKGRRGCEIGAILDRSRLQDVTAEVFSGPASAARKWSKGITGGAKIIKNKYYQQGLELCAS